VELLASQKGLFSVMLFMKHRYAARSLDTSSHIHLPIAVYFIGMLSKMPKMLFV
jgi:hypothetical protein